MKYTIPTAQKEELIAMAQKFNDEIKSCSEPEVLEEYYKVIKKFTKLSTRKYLAAYLLLNQTVSQKRKRNFQEKRERSFPQKGFSAERTEIKRKPRPTNTTEHKENTKTLFVGVGRNRKVFPQDLIELFAEELSISQDLFGLTKIFKTYSFIEVPSELCEKAIKTLSGTEFRKTRLKVNFSKEDQPLLEDQE